MTPLIKAIVGILLGILAGFIVSYWLPEEVAGWAIVGGVIIGGIIAYFITDKEKELLNTKKSDKAEKELCPDCKDEECRYSGGDQPCREGDIPKCVEKINTKNPTNKNKGRD